MTRRTPATERFWPKVEKTGTCWLWRGALSSQGYGNFWDGARYIHAHIFAYQELVGTVPEGHVLDHVKARGCFHTNCVNPAHLEAVTQRVNVLRGDGPTARAAARITCPRGHAYTTENTYLCRGKRQCRVCRYEAGKRYYRRIQERRAA